MTLSRRRFLGGAGAVALGFMGLRRAVARPGDGAGYGPLVRDPKGVLDLPEGFEYGVISRGGQKMTDGYYVPHLPDGMAAFEGPDGVTILLRNHECDPPVPGPFAHKRELVKKLGDKLYDKGGGLTPGPGGVTTIVYDTKKRRTLREFLSLAGTYRNCAGGPTPWGSWISCEEDTTRKGLHEECLAEKDHGRLVGVTAKGGIYTFAYNRVHTEFAGAVFSPDGTTLFVNLQDAGKTIAITGPWAA